MSNQKESIVFVVPNLLAGGAERVTVNFIRQIKGNQRSIYLVLLDGQCQLVDLVPSHVKIVNLSTIKARDSLLALSRFIRQLRPEIVYSTHSRITVLLSFIKKFGLGFKLISRVPSMPSLERKQGYTHPVVAKIYSWAYGHSDLVLVQTDEMKRDVRLEYGVPDERLVVASNPLDTAYIDSMVQGLDSPFDNSYLNIVASGRHAKAKGFEMLIEAFQYLHKARPDTRLYVLGRESEKTHRLKESVLKLSLEDNVIFTGFCSNPYKYYANCDLFVLSSIREGFPNALLENYYLNTPLVSTPCVPVVSRLISTGINGYISPGFGADDFFKCMDCALELRRDYIENGEYMGFRFEQLFEKINT